MASRMTNTNGRTVSSEEVLTTSAREPTATLSVREQRLQTSIESTTLTKLQARILAIQDEKRKAGLTRVSIANSYEGFRNADQKHLLHVLVVS